MARNLVRMTFTMIKNTAARRVSILENLTDLIKHMFRFSRAIDSENCMGSVKDHVFIPPLPLDVPELCERITCSLNNVDSTMLSKVCQELDNRSHVCLGTKGLRIKHL
ncbi:hypothetical protein NPIL_571791 [Nephila pilipes]|uniref:Uncharacterized protein n=1 Tax=Nephila pilipes TaxID=299642 RepID=A0A8X6PCZ2_NEPPI|nr:hypothetical protein NPIL_157371 [Nephila pilipes]GFT58385.1 hypothetical protein NPIL_571791 [Nephila pilipes]